MKHSETTLFFAHKTNAFSYQLISVTLTHLAGGSLPLRRYWRGVASASELARPQARMAQRAIAPHPPRLIANPSPLCDIKPLQASRLRHGFARETDVL